MLQSQLEVAGYEVITAYDGTTGLKKALEGKPDLILLDVVMPKIDGFTTLRWLKARDETKRVPIIMLSARGETSALLKGEELGATDYVIKGCEAEALLKHIHRYI